MISSDRMSGSGRPQAAFMNLSDIDRLFDESTINNLQKFAKKVETVFCPQDVQTSPTSNNTWMSYDIVKYDVEYVVNIDVPGVSKAQIDLTVIEPDEECKTPYLKVIVERRKSASGILVVDQRASGKIDKVICLPSDADVKKSIDALYEDGVLSIRVKRIIKTTAYVSEGRKVPIV